MAFQDEDTLLTLTVEPDTDAVGKALERVGKEMDDLGKEAGAAMEKGLKFQNIDKWIKDGLDEIEKLKTAQAEGAALSDPKLASLRADLAMSKELTKEQLHQNELLRMREQLDDPDRLKDEVRRQRELNALKEEYDAKRGAEEKRQGVKKDDGRGQVTNVLLGGIMGGKSGELSQVGGMLGEAVGGPAGAMIGEMAGKALQAGLEMPAKAVAGGFNLIKNSLQGLQGELGPIGVGFDLVSSVSEGLVDAVAMVSPALAAIIGPLSKLPEIFKGILETSVSLAKVASPGTYNLFKMAVEDVQGSIGQKLLPVLELMTDMVRELGSMLKTILPSGDEVRTMLRYVKEAFAGVGDDLRTIASELGPWIRVWLVGAVRNLAMSLHLLLAPLTMTAKVVAWLSSKLSGVNKEMGVGGLQSTVGDASRQASFNSVEGYQQQLQAAAFSGGAANQNNVPSLVGNIDVVLGKLADYIGGGGLARDIAAGIGNAVGNAVPNLPTPAQAAAASGGALPQAAAAGLDILGKFRQQFGF